MESRKLVCILSTIISQITLLIILLFPSDHHHSQTLIPQFQTLISLLHHHLDSSSSESLTRVRKRTRTHFSESDSDPNPSPPGPPKLARLGRVDSFRVTFKMSSSTFEWLSGLLEPLLECRDPAHLPMEALSAELRLGIGLFRLATGSSYDELARRFRVSGRVAKFCTKQLCRVLCTNFRFWVGFPGPDEARSVCSSFDELTGLPNCCGVIGCTRFTMKNEHEHEHGHDRVAAQIVVDSSCRILSIVAGYSGSMSNAEILKSSTLYSDVESGTLLNGENVSVCEVNVPQYLVGGKGYPLLPWLITPFDDDNDNNNDNDDVLPGSIKERFNAFHELITRVSIQKTIASLRSWGILSKPFDEEFRDGVAYIGSCAILHNALLLREDDSGLCDNSSTIDEHNDCHDSMVHDQDITMGLKSTKGYVIRNALATKAKDLSRSKGLS